MASKLQNISALSNEIGKSLADYENWTAFLKSAAWQYKYSFKTKFDLCPATGRNGVCEH